jgi:hypothetical protein
LNRLELLEILAFGSAVFVGLMYSVYPFTHSAEIMLFLVVILFNFIFVAYWLKCVAEEIVGFLPLKKRGAAASSGHLKVSIGSHSDFVSSLELMSSNGDRLDKTQLVVPSPKDASLASPDDSVSMDDVSKSLKN